MTTERLTLKREYPAGVSKRRCIVLLSYLSSSLLPSLLSYWFVQPLRVTSYYCVIVWRDTMTTYGRCWTKSTIPIAKICNQRRGGEKNSLPSIQTRHLINLNSKSRIVVNNIHFNDAVVHEAHRTTLRHGRSITDSVGVYCAFCA